MHGKRGCVFGAREGGSGVLGPNIDIGEFAY